MWQAGAGPGEAVGRAPRCCSAPLIYAALLLHALIYAALLLHALIYAAVRPTRRSR